MSKYFFIPLVIACTAVQGHAELYHVTDLGTLGQGARASFAYGINAIGQVVGESYTAGSTFDDAFLWSNGTMLNLGTLGGGNSVAYGVNASGQVTGWSYLTGNAADHAFLYSNGAMQDLGDLGDGTGGSEAYGINDAGQIIGATVSSTGSKHAFLYSNGVMHDLGTLGGIGSMANGVNAAGEVVGESDTTGFNGGHAFLYSNGTMQDIGTLGGSGSAAYGVNDSGQIVGWSYGSGANTPYLHAFLYSNGAMQDLGTLGGPQGTSIAYGINASGQVVGETSTNTSFHGMIYESGSMSDLNSLLDHSGLGVTVSIAQGINDSGLIAAYGFTPTSNGFSHALLLTPIAANVVVPDSFTLFRGIQAGGSLYGMQFGDAWYMSVHPGLTLQSSEAPVQVQVSGTSPTATPASLQFKFTGNVNSVGLSQSLLLYNFTTASYETVDTRSASLNADQTVTITATGTLSRFVDPSTKEVRARVAFKATGPTSLSSWTANLGVVNWIIQ